MNNYFQVSFYIKYDRYNMKFGIDMQMLDYIIYIIQLVHDHKFRNLFFTVHKA